MAFSTTAIRYGWAALTSLGVLTGTTIYVLNNTRHQVKPQDIIELTIGTDERCMALQTADGTFPVARPSFVRIWTSNVYTTTNVTIYTNVVTNTIGWSVDRDMMVSLDSTIKALVPYYVDTNTVYDGTTNIVMLTVTGLWASLGIGDHTNKFTRTPVIETNVTTYGDYPWQIYIEDLQERYKVLNALRITQLILSSMVTNGSRRWAVGGNYSELVVNFDATDWSPSSLAIGAYLDEDPFFPLSMYRGRGQWRLELTSYIPTNTPVNSYQVYLHFKNMDISPSIDYFYPDDHVTNASWALINTFSSTNSFPYTTSQYGAFETALSEHQSSPFIESWEAIPQLYIDWQFYYCTNKYW